MKKCLFLGLCLSIAVGNAMGQAVRKCATDEVLAEKLANDPALLAAYKAHRQQTDLHVAAFAAAQTQSAQKTTATITIPVVFHFVLDSLQFSQIKGMDGINRRVASQLKVLNNDFNAENDDISSVPSVFKSVIGAANIHFGMARVDPMGKASGGINLKVEKTITGAPLTFSAGPGTEKHQNSGGIDAWDHEKYLNIWVTNIKDGVLGYALSPGNARLSGAPEEGGVVIDYAAFGVRNTTDNYFISGADRGRTMTHEVGHYFDLNHIWGTKDDCSDDDGISDTPKQDEATTTCPQGIVANCDGSTGGKMYMNYMDYVQDKCMYLFTKGQVTRMLAQMAAGGESHKLATNPQLTWWPSDVAGIEKADAFTVYPNPASTSFTINFMAPATGTATIEVWTFTGQRIKSISVTGGQSSHSVDAAGWSKGVYLLRCRFDGGSTITKKIVLQ